MEQITKPVSCRGHLTDRFLGDTYRLPDGTECPSPFATIHQDKTATLRLPGRLVIPAEAVYDTGLFKPPAERSCTDVTSLETFTSNFVKPVVFLVHVANLSDDFVKTFDVDNVKTFHLLRTGSYRIKHYHQRDTRLYTSWRQAVKTNTADGILKWLPLMKRMPCDLYVTRADETAGLDRTVVIESPIKVELPFGFDVKRMLIDDNIPEVPLCGEDLPKSLLIVFEPPLKPSKITPSTGYAGVIYSNDNVKGGLLDAIM